MPVAPSVMPTGDLDAFRAAAEAIGFPLLIKAAAGGGGKGMSIVRSRPRTRRGRAHRRQRGERYFGDGRIYAETYVERPRHIEVQVAGDGEGGAIHLFERECSVQRRFQKIVEEAPAPNLSAGACATTSAAPPCGSPRPRATATSARWSSFSAPDGRFFFLEMNTRLQVEHPVTEMITGLDLVGAATRHRRGPRPGVRRKSDVSANGARHRSAASAPKIPSAISCRRPASCASSTSPRRRICGSRTRWIEGQKVTADFDPMLAKLVAHGADREEAIDARCSRRCATSTLLGVTTNIDYLARVIAHPAFRAGELHTGFVKRTCGGAGGARTRADASIARAVIAAALGFREFRELAFGAPEPHASIGPWRN